MTALSFPNKFPGNCVGCGIYVPTSKGVCSKENGKWTLRCSTTCAGTAPVQAKPLPAPKPTANVGDLSGILALFAKARTHLKFPAIVLSVDENLSIRINVAGERAKVPGSLTVVDADRDGNGERDWFGRILLDGTFQSSKAAAPHMPKLAERLSQFAANPSKVGGEDGRLHGRCCFCRKALKDERSTAVGYGKICADHFGLDWGQRPDEFAAAAA